MKPPSDKKENQTNTYLKYSGLALQLLLTIGVFGWLGHLLDSYLAFTFPVFLLLFGFAGFAGMMVYLYRTINRP
jgi:hypothetical protein